MYGPLDTTPLPHQEWGGQAAARSRESRSLSICRSKDPTPASPPPFRLTHDEAPVRGEGWLGWQSEERGLGTHPILPAHKRRTKVLTQSQGGRMWGGQGGWEVTPCAGSPPLPFRPAALGRVQSGVEGVGRGAGG